MGNYQSDIFLYAKGWYQKTDTISDLKKIFSKIYSQDIQYVRIDDIERVLLDLAWIYIVNGNAPYKFVEFMMHLKSWHNNNVIEACLGCISIIETKYIEGGLNPPDPNLLPLTNADGVDRFLKMNEQ